MVWRRKGGNMREAVFLYWGIQSGTGKDFRVLAPLLEEKYVIKRIPTRRREDRIERVGHFLQQSHRLFFPYELQVHLEQIHREQFRFGKSNLVFINPEWTDPRVFRKMSQVPWILCKTRHAFDLCQDLGSTVHYTGFTSEDFLDESVSKDFGVFLHVAGKNDYKGSQLLYDLWAKHPEWPQLHMCRSPFNHYGERKESLPTRSNVVVHEEWMADKDFLELCNRCGIHLCPSEMEGFGHTLMEGMSTGAIVVTTDGQPMNEIVRPDRGVLVEAEEIGRNFMSPRYTVKEKALEAAVANLLEKPEEECRQLGQASRQYFLSNDAAFRQRFRDFLLKLDS